jgi:endonuclease/exonuclease/phosphatase family metal-dependent hydrolase
MKILTLNTWNVQGPWQQRWEIIFEALERIRPDIAAFQEVQKGDWAGEIQRRSGFEHMVFPEEPGGLMFLSRFPIQEWECLTLKTQSATEEYKRYALYARLDMGAQSLSVFDTHLSWRLPEGKTRERQVGELLDFIKRRTAKGLVLAMGDFNAPPDTKEIRKMMLEGGFIDLFGVKHPGKPGLTWDNMNPFAAGSSEPLPNRRIDYIFMQGLSITKVAAVDVVLTKPKNGIFASDHFGVLAELNL